MPPSYSKISSTKVAKKIDTHLTHVRNVKQRSLSFGAAPKVLLHNATVGGIVSLVQDGQFVPCKGYHFATKVFVPLIERGWHERFRRSGSCHGTVGRFGNLCARRRRLEGFLQETTHDVSDVSVEWFRYLSLNVEVSKL